MKQYESYDRNLSGECLDEHGYSTHVRAPVRPKSQPVYKMTLSFLEDLSTEIIVSEPRSDDDKEAEELKKLVDDIFDVESDFIMDF